MASFRKSPQFGFGLFNKKERWSLSWRGWLALFALVLALGGIVFFRIQPFLAVTRRVPANYLVVEGWGGKPVARAAVAEFRTGRYQKIFVTGIPLPGALYATADDDADSYRAAEYLRMYGVPAAYIQLVGRPQVMRDRTYSSARALRDWIRYYRVPAQSLNVVTSSAHARRTWLLFREGLGTGFQVGIISAPNPLYDSHHWWRYSEGVREVINESIAWVYAEFIFRPDKKG